MLETSVDIWYISLSVGLLVLIGFISYVLYYLGRLVKDMSGTVGEVNHKLEMMDETINLANDTLRMTNESVRNVLSVTDNLVNTFSSLSDEIKKVLATFSSMSGILTGLVETVGKLSSKKK